jgi:hypothetical protein
MPPTFQSHGAALQVLPIVSAPTKFLMAALLALVSFAVLASWAIVCLFHLQDAYQLDHTSGVWIGLVHHLKQGVLYPEVYDGQVFGGSRYMPGYFSLHAALAELTGEMVLSGKLLSLGTAVACLCLIFLVLRQLDCSHLMAFALTTLAAASTTVFFASTTIRGDLLPVVCQLAALSFAYRGGKGGLALAGFCCGLGLMCKVSALWAPAAIGIHLLTRDWRGCGVFLVALVGSVGAGLGLIDVLSDGRLAENVRVFSEPAFFLLILKSPSRLLLFAAGTSPTLVILTPFVVVECWTAWCQRRLTVFHTSFVACIGMVLLVLADRGTTFNHLVDLEVLAAIVTGLFWRTAVTAGPAQSAARSVVVVAILWGLVALWARNLGHPVRDVADAWLGREVKPAYPAKPLAGLIPDDATLLSEDARVPVTRGQTPVVLDPYALAIIAKKHPDWADDLIRRIRDKTFQFVVLQYRLDEDPDVNEGWYNIILGRPIATAIRENYRFERQADGFSVLVPK